MISPLSTEQVIISAALDAGFDPHWLLWTAWLESRMQLDLVGAVGECGPLQLHPRYFGQACADGIAEQARVSAGLIAAYRRAYGPNWEMVRLAYVSPRMAQLTAASE